MKTITIVLLVIAVFLLFAISIFWGIPLGSEKGKTEVVGKRQDGSVIVSEQEYCFKVHPLSAEGIFCRSTRHNTYFYEHTGDRKTELTFFTTTSHHYELLKPILPVSNTNKWAAFRLSSVEREKVDLLMYIFDHKKIIHTFKITNAIRISTGTDGWGNTDSYSISQSGTGGTITINTLDGLVSYDQSSDRLTTGGAPVAK